MSKQGMKFAHEPHPGSFYNSRA